MNSGDWVESMIALDDDGNWCLIYFSETAKQDSGKIKVDDENHFHLHRKVSGISEIIKRTA